MFNWNKIQSTEIDRKDCIEFNKVYLNTPYFQKLEGEFVEFILVEPNYWEGYRKREIGEPLLQFQMRRTNSNQYIVEYFNTNQRVIATPLNKPEDVISVLDVSIKLGVKY